MGLIDLLLGDDDLEFAQTISPSSPAPSRNGDDGEDRAAFRAQVSENRKIVEGAEPARAASAPLQTRELRVGRATSAITNAEAAD